MITIRQAQMHVLNEQADQCFATRIIALLREYRSAIVGGIAEAELNLKVANAIQRARLHNIQSEIGIFRFVDLMFCVGPNFDEHPAIRTLLNNDSISPDERIATLVMLLLPDDWERVKLIRDESTWAPTHGNEGATSL